MTQVLLPFVMAGDPSLDALPTLLAEAKALGLPAIEVGLPHSDPIADGPALQAAAQRAIQRGLTPEGVLSQLAQAHESPDVVLFTYLNPLLQMGVDRLLERLRPTPVKALLIVDLPFGEEVEFESRLRAEGYPIVPLLAPTTTLDRAAQLLRERPDPGEEAPFAQRFAYVVARLGVTGTRGSLDLIPVAQRVKALQSITSRPLAVGFGLSEVDALQSVREWGAVPVVGSALVDSLQTNASLAAFLAPRLATPSPLR